MSNKTILFLHFGSFSLINESVLKAFYKIFPEYKIETIDLKALLKNMSKKEKIKLIYKTLIHTKRFSWKGVKGSYSKSIYYWELTNQLISKAVKKKDYVFSFQTQSNFNGNLVFCPHYIYTDHTHLVNLGYPDFNRNQINSKDWIDFETTLYQNSNGIFTMSNHVKNSLLNQYYIDSNKVKCVFAGANISQTDVQYLLERYQKKNILFVGVAWERKGGPELFEAFKLIYQKHPDAILNIVGCSPDIQHPNVKIWGRLPKQEVKKHYESASIFCMPSKREPFGIVYLEAMSYKLPIVALNIGALPDFVEKGKNGFLLEFKDIQGMASQIIYLLDNPELGQEMGKYGYKKVNQQYHWEKSVSSIRKFIENQKILEMKL
ncbi:glycosyltransferase family 4 protein [Aquiflexum lacus]|uniref:glycosyltransferase family 4 protein n=1 Tax=Aquiflexum lacus TaxID=2483805 RepID=UPI001894E935|nr:glycosyltransferase family 4 protein [Aquiflexum lacus]